MTEISQPGEASLSACGTFPQGGKHSHIHPAIYVTETTDLRKSMLFIINKHEILLQESTKLATKIRNRHINKKPGYLPVFKRIKR